jgi:hypothetical protein
MPVRLRLWLWRAWLYELARIGMWLKCGAILLQSVGAHYMLMQLSFAQLEYLRVCILK